MERKRKEEAFNFKLSENRSASSIFKTSILTPVKKFFSSYFLERPAATYPLRTEEKIYGPTPVLSGHVGVAKTTLVKRLEDHTTEETLLDVNFGDGLVLSMRPEVIVFKVASVPHGELQTAYLSVFSLGQREKEFVGYQIPYFEELFLTSDQFRFSFRSLLLSLIKGRTFGGQAIPEKYRVEVDDDGFAVHYRTGIRLEDKDLVREEVARGNRDLKVVSVIYRFARPAVLLLYDPDKNQAPAVQNLLSSLILDRSFENQLTFYSAYIIAARNRVAPGERADLDHLYAIQKPAFSENSILEDMNLFQEIYLDPSAQEVYSPVIEHLVKRFEGECSAPDKLCGVREFLTTLANTRIRTPYGSEYSLLYYVPGAIPFGEGLMPFEEEYGEAVSYQIFKGFATFRSYERLLSYLSKKKSEGKRDRRVINLPFIGAILGYLFPTSTLEMGKYGYISENFAKALAKLVEDNFGYSPYDPKGLSDKEAGFIFSTSSDVILQESAYSGVPVAFYGPPGLGKTSKAEALVWEVNSSLFKKIRENKEFREEVLSFLKLHKLHGIHFSENPEEIIQILVSKLLTIRIGSEQMSSPYAISGTYAPLPLLEYPAISEITESIGDKSDPLYSHIQETISAAFPEGANTLVKSRVPELKAVITEKFLLNFPESYAVLILDHFTLANLVVQKSLSKALSEKIIAGYRFSDEAFEKVKIIATGSYSSSIFGTSVSEMDLALVAEFANWFREEPTQEDIDTFLNYLVKTVLSTVDTSKVPQEDIYELSSYILREGENSLRDLIFNMTYVSGRKPGIRDYKEYLESSVWGHENPEDLYKHRAPFPSFREISHLLLHRLLPLWLPQSAPLTPEDNGINFEALRKNGSTDVVSSRAEAFRKIVSLLKELLSNPFAVASRVYNANQLIPRYPVPGAPKPLFHPYSNLAFIPEPSEDVFPNLRTALIDLGKVSENLFEAHYVEYSSLLPGARLLLGDRDFSSHKFFLADTSIEKLLGSIPWDELYKKFPEEVSLYSELILMAPGYASHTVYSALQDLVHAILEDRIMFFPGHTFAYGSIDSDPKLIRANPELIRASAEQQKRVFLETILKIYTLYCKIKVKEMLGIP